MEQRTKSYRVEVASKVNLLNKAAFCQYLKMFVVHNRDLKRIDTNTTIRFRMMSSPNHLFIILDSTKVVILLLRWKYYRLKVYFSRAVQLMAFVELESLTYRHLMCKQFLRNLKMVAESKNPIQQRVY